MLIKKDAKVKLVIQMLAEPIIVRITDHLLPQNHSDHNSSMRLDQQIFKLLPLMW